MHLSWAESEEAALEIAHDQWKTNVFGSDLAWNLETPAQFDEAARFEHVMAAYRICIEPEPVALGALQDPDPAHRDSMQ